MLTTVGTGIDANGEHAEIVPQAYCESICVFLLLSGRVRYVPDGTHVGASDLERIAPITPRRRATVRTT